MPKLSSAARWCLTLLSGCNGAGPNFDNRNITRSMEALVKKGLVRRHPQTQYFQITDAGIEALWPSIETAPRDGTPVRLWARDAMMVPMRWNVSGRNSLVQPGEGIWEHPSGELTWSEYDPAGAPTHWHPIPAHMLPLL